MRIEMKVIHTSVKWEEAMFPSDKNGRGRVRNSENVYTSILSPMYGNGSSDMLAIGELTVKTIEPLPVGKWFWLEITPKA